MYLDVYRCLHICRYLSICGYLAYFQAMKWPFLYISEYFQTQKYANISKYLSICLVVPNFLLTFAADFRT